MTKTKMSSEWTEEEEAIFKKLYALGSNKQLQEAFPGMTQRQMKIQARKMRISRVPFDKLAKESVEDLQNSRLISLDTKTIIQRASLKAKDLFSSGKVTDPLILRREPLKALIEETSRELQYPGFVLREALEMVKLKEIRQLPAHRPLASALILSHILRVYWKRSEIPKIAVVLGLSPSSLATKYKTMKEILSTVHEKSCNHPLLASIQQDFKQLPEEVF